MRACDAGLAGCRSADLVAKALPPGDGGLAGPIRRRAWVSLDTGQTPPSALPMRAGGEHVGEELLERVVRRERNADPAPADGDAGANLEEPGMDRAGLGPGERGALQADRGLLLRRYRGVFVRH